MSHVVLTAVLSCLFCFLKSIQVYRRYRVDNTHRISAVALTGAGSDTAADVMSSLTLHVRSYRKTCNGLSQTFCLVTSDVEAGKIWNHPLFHKSKKREWEHIRPFSSSFFFSPTWGSLTTNPWIWPRLPDCNYEHSTFTTLWWDNMKWWQLKNLARKLSFPSLHEAVFTKGVLPGQKVIRSRQELVILITQQNPNHLFKPHVKTASESKA